MPRRLLAALTGVALFALLFAQPLPAHAAYSIYGKVTRIVDGDTVMVDLWGDGTTTPVSVRNAGIQSMEHDQCHFSQASSAMSRLTLGKKVRLTAAYASSSSQGRPVRFVDVVNSNGSTTDPQLAQLTSGQALWLVIPPESGRALQYHTAMEQAAAAKVGLWDNDFCGSGPYQTAKIKIWAHYDGDGDESQNVNAERVEVVNAGTTTVSLGGWWIRTGAQDSIRIPSGMSIAPGKMMILYVGKGTNTSTRLYWGYSSPRFSNLTATNKIGSGVYLFDPQGDVRAHQSYPCVVSCFDAAKGKVTLRANYDPPGDESKNPNSEYVDIVSTSDSPVDLSYRVVQIGGSTRELGAGSVLKTTGSKIRVYMGHGTSTSTTRYWNRDTTLMVNAGGTVVLRSTNAIQVACTSWGSGRC